MKKALKLLALVISSPLELKIFEEENSLFADREGVWFFCESFELADFRVYFTEERYQAHFTVYFIDTASFAGCN